MYSIFKKEDIINGLSKAIGIIPLKTGSSYLRSLWIEAKEDKLTIMATDATTEFTGSYKAEVKESGCIGVNAKIFVDLISKLPAHSNITLKYEKENNILHVEQDHRKYKLATADPTWFKALDPFPEENSIIWAGDSFQEIIDKTYFCISDDESTEQLSCFYMKKVDDKIDCCGLNGHQLAVISFINDDLANILPETGLLIQKKYISELRKWLDVKEIVLNITDTKLFLRNEENTEILSFKRSYYNYPNHIDFLSRLQIVSPSILKINRRKMLEALGRISLFNNDNEKCTYFDLSANHLELSAQGQEVGSAKENIDVSYNGEITKIAFATKNIKDVLENFISDEVEFKLTGTESTCGITGDQDLNYTVIIMPVKISTVNMYDEE